MRIIKNIYKIEIKIIVNNIINKKMLIMIILFSIKYKKDYYKIELNL